MNCQLSTHSYSHVPSAIVSLVGTETSGAACAARRNAWVSHGVKVQNRWALNRTCPPNKACSLAVRNMSSLSPQLQGVCLVGECNY